jgi:CDP-paratose 2-epimerase
MKTIQKPDMGRAVRRILVTGGCGFIGSNLVDALAARGEMVLAFDAMLREGSQENARWLASRWGDRVKIVTGDVRDAAAVRAAVTNCLAVIHLAAQVAVTTSLEDPVEDFSVNALGTLTVLEAVRRYNPAAPVIFASTNKVYGMAMPADRLVRKELRYEPIDERWAQGIGEAAPLDLYSPYGCSKGAADQYVRDYARVFGLKTVVLRMSCIYGPRQFGTEDQGWLAHFVLKAQAGDPISIYGDGFQVRDVLFIDDAVDAWLGALDGASKLRGRIFNLGGGASNAISLREAIDHIARLHGKAPQLRFSDWRPGDQPWYVSDISAISAALDWSPRFSVQHGLRALDQWISSRFTDHEAPPRLQGVGA